MKNLPLARLVFVTSILSTGLIGCGGGGSSTPETVEQQPAPVAPAPEPTVYTGVFLDSAVQGLGYETASQSGFTNDKGEFSYQAGEKVTFYIGGIRFPAVDVAEVITPLSVFGTEQLDDESVINMLRFLQTLDVDGMPENGIELAESLHDLAANLTVDFDNPLFETLVNALLVSNNAVNISLVSPEQALAHFRTTLATLNPSTGTGCETTHEKVGYTGSFQTYAHNVSGTVTVVDNCTLRLDTFSYDGLGPDVYFYGLTDGDTELTKAFAMSDAIHGTVFETETVFVHIPDTKSLDDFDTISVWCVAANANFGEALLTAP